MTNVHTPNTQTHSKGQSSKSNGLCHCEIHVGTNPFKITIKSEKTTDAALVTCDGFEITNWLSTGLKSYPVNKDKSYANG